MTTPQPINPLAFAREFAAFREQLEWVGRGAGGCNCGGQAEVALSYLTLLRALEEGQDAVGAIATAIQTYNKESSETTRLQEAARQRWQVARGDKMTEEEITRKVACPYCGAEPGTSCRTTGEFRTVRTDSHRDRYRLARKLVDNPAYHDEAP